MLHDKFKMITINEGPWQFFDSVFKEKNKIYVARDVLYDNENSMN